MATNESKARYLTAVEWAANDRAASSKPRPFPQVSRRVCLPDRKYGYFQTVDGRWWLDNEQLGHVEVLPTSRALVATLAALS